MVKSSKAGFKSRLAAAIKERGTCLCVGVDPPFENLPSFAADLLQSKGPAGYLNEYTSAIIEVSAGRVPAIKFQSAFYEAFGAGGVEVLTKMVARAKAKGLLTILDAKRGDITSTMKAYGRMAFEIMDADSLTITPYMGRDVIEPLLPWLRAGKGVYVVWVTSNQAGALVQDHVANVIFDDFVDYFEKEGATEALGFVLGATRTDALSSKQREQLHATSLLMPGIGAQGGVVSPYIRELIRGSGPVLVPQSRAVAQVPASTRNINEYIKLIEKQVVAAAAELAIGPTLV